MKKNNLMNESLINALVVSTINQDDKGQKVFATFIVENQQDNILEVRILWREDSRDKQGIQVEEKGNSIRQMKVDDIWVFPTSVSEAKEEALKAMGLEYRFYKDEKALERLAGKLEMDKMNIGYDEESEEGTWFNCCRTDSSVSKILPEGIYIYSLRAADEDDSLPASIEKQVIVNHYGDILTDKELKVPVMLEVEEIQYDEEGNIIG